MSESVLITGGNGFIGSHLATSLRDAGFGVVRSSADILDRESLISELRLFNPAVVVHLAAISHPNVCDQDRGRAESVNVFGTRNLLEAIELAGSVRRLVFASTAQVYRPLGPDGGVLTEDSPVEPINFYAATKLSAEDLIRHFSAKTGIESVVFRIFNHVHKTQSAQTFLGSVYRSLLAAEDFGTRIPVGNLELWRDLGSIKDLIAAFRVVCATGIPLVERYSLFNLCNGHPRRLGDLALLLAQRMGKDVIFELDKERLRPGEPRTILGSHARATHLLGWTPVVVSNEDLIDSFLADSPIL